MNNQQTHLQTKVKAVVKNITTTHLQRARDEAMKLAQDEDGILSIGKYDHDIIDEIVTSTYLKAVEDCEALVEKHDPNVRMDRKTSSAYWGNKLREALQSLKQTKD